MRGEVLEGRYRLVEKLGAGGMGEVWRAVDSRLDREVAVKTITQGGDADRQLTERFRREARTAARLAHPHIVTVHDHGEAELGGRLVLFLVMELVQGRSMAFRTTEELSVAAVVAWGLQICDGLAEAHRIGIVHRDIKPANIMVFGEGELNVKICDFGIARLVEDSGPGLTGTGAAIGTPAYMSPEQARGELSIDGRSDLYSLGCLLYELLSGVPPFKGAGWSLLAQHISQRPEPVSTLRPAVPDDLDRLILDLLHKDPDRRPSTADEVSRRLSGVLEHLGSAPREAVEFAQAPTADATRAQHPEHAPSRPAPRLTEPDSPRADRVQTIPRTGQIIFRSGLLAAGLLYAQFALLTDWTPVWTAVLCVLAFATVMIAAYLGAPVKDSESEVDPAVSSTCMALLCALLTAVFLLIWPPAPWWTALLAGVLAGPLFIFSAAGIRRAVESAVRRGRWQAEVGTTCGLINGVVLAGLLAAGPELPVLIAILSGIAAWAVVALLIAFLLPRAAGQVAQEG